MVFRLLLDLEESYIVALTRLTSKPVDANHRGGPLAPNVIAKLFRSTPINNNMHSCSASHLDLLNGLDNFLSECLHRSEGPRETFWIYD